MMSLARRLYANDLRDMTQMLKALVLGDYCTVRRVFTCDLKARFRFDFDFSSGRLECPSVAAAVVCRVESLFALARARA